MRKLLGSKSIDQRPLSFSSKSTTKDTQSVIKDMLGVTVVQQYEKYIGLPFLVGHNKKESFTHIKQQVWKKLQG